MPESRIRYTGVAARLSIAVAVLVLIAASTAGAQSAGKRWRIGYLDQGSAGRNGLFLEGLRQGLRERGWVEGQNIAIEARCGGGRAARPALAEGLVRAKVDVIVTTSTPAALAAKHATATIPIVIGFAADPVGSGIVTNLARPGDNITGWTHQGLELRAKYLELLKEAAPAATRFGVLWNPSNQVHGPSLKVIEGAAQRLKVELHLASPQDPKDLPHAIAGLVGKGVQALVVFPDGMFLAQMSQIIALAARYRLPAMYGLR